MPCQRVSALSLTHTHPPLPLLLRPSPCNFSPNHLHIHFKQYIERRDDFRASGALDSNIYHYQDFACSLSVPLNEEIRDWDQNAVEILVLVVLRIQISSSRSSSLNISYIYICIIVNISYIYMYNCAYMYTTHYAHAHTCIPLYITTHYAHAHICIPLYITTHYAHAHICILIFIQPPPRRSHAQLNSNESWAYESFKWTLYTHTIPCPFS